MKETVLGGLKVRITGGTDREGAGDGPLVVLLHGFGAPGDDLVSLWRALRVPTGTRFLFPEAPLSLGPGFMGGRAWWHIDMLRIQQAIARREPRDMNEVPEGMSGAHDAVVRMLDAADKALSPSKVVLGGFSQGAMLSCDVALRTERPLAGLVLLSGTFVAAGEWTPLMPKRAKMRVFQSHGMQDEILPFTVAESLRDALRAAGIDVTWVPFTGGHGIPPKALDTLGDYLGQVLG